MPRYCLPFLTVLLLLVGATHTRAQMQLSSANTKARNLFEKAQSQAKSREFAKAIETLAVLNQKFPSLGEPFVVKGSLLKALGDNRAAFEAYRTGLQLLPFEPARSLDYFTLGELAIS